MLASLRATDICTRLCVCLFNNYSSSTNYSTIFAEPEENNCFSIIDYQSKCSRNIINRAVSILKISASLLILLKTSGTVFLNTDLLFGK